MKKVNIKLSTIEDVRSFVNIVTAYTGEVDLSSGRYVVDAKSIMGIFSLDLMSPIKVIVEEEKYEEVVSKIGKFIIKD